MQDQFILEGKKEHGTLLTQLHGGGGCGLVHCEHVRGDGQDGAHALFYHQTRLPRVPYFEKTIINSTEDQLLVVIK
jgi:hypothetical protein